MHFLNRKQRGELSELAFIYKATGLGFHVSKPYGDSSRYDFIVEHLGHCSKVQVKATTQQLAAGAYFIQTKRRLNNSSARYLPGEIDFFACHIVPVDAWYIFPLEAIGQKFHVDVYPHLPERDRRYGRYREAWHLLTGLDPRTAFIPWICACEDTVPSSGLARV